MAKPPQLQPQKTTIEQRARTSAVIPETVPSDEDPPSLFTPDAAPDAAPQDKPLPRHAPIERIGRRSYDQLAENVMRALYDMEGYDGFCRARAALVVAQRRLGREWTKMQKAERKAKSEADAEKALKPTDDNAAEG